MDDWLVQWWSNLHYNHLLLVIQFSALHCNDIADWQSDDAVEFWTDWQKVMHVFLFTENNIKENKCVLVVKTQTVQSQWNICNMDSFNKSKFIVYFVNMHSWQIYAFSFISVTVEKVFMMLVKWGNFITVMHKGCMSIYGSLYRTEIRMLFCLHYFYKHNFSMNPTFLQRTFLHCRFELGCISKLSTKFFRIFYFWHT